MGALWATSGAEDGESRAAILEVLRNMVAETGGIRAPGARPGPPETASAVAAREQAEEALEPLRGVLGLRLPVRVGRGAGPIGGVGIRNEREPAIVIYPALGELPPPERRFRLTLAAVLVRAGLAVVLDPAGASLHELLAALAHLADPTEVPGLPGARTIAGVWARRGVTGERVPAALRAALAEELRWWRQDEAHVARLAARLREDAIVAAVRLSGAVDGALWAIARDARMPAPVDEASARAVLASAPARELLIKRLGLFALDDAA